MILNPLIGPSGVNPVAFSAQNKDAGTLPAGSPVATHPSGTGIVGASAASLAGPSVGVLLADVAPGFAAPFVSVGPVTLADWTTVVGTPTLAARAVYYLAPTAGLLTTTPPAAPGQVVQRVGVAVSTVTLELQLDRPILL